MKQLLFESIERRNGRGRITCISRGRYKVVRTNVLTPVTQAVGSMLAIIATNIMPWHAG